VTGAAKANPLVDFVKQSMDLEDAAEIARRADVLEGMGYERTASHLREHATRIRSGKPRRPAPLKFRSPIPEASDEQWARFVRLMQVGDVAAVTPTGQVGIFQTRLKRLEDLGLVRGVRRVQHAGAAPSWSATFRPPLTLARLLSDPLLQYRIFVVSMKRYRDEVLARHRDAIGKEIEGKPATLSGLMAVSQHAGPALGSWLASEADRKRFKQTTAAYGRTTGVF
jgi:hypothetical protein